MILKMALYEEKTTLYFRLSGRECTEPTLRAAIKRASELQIPRLVVASTRGYTAKRAIALNSELQAGLEILVVGEHCGYHEPGRQEMPVEVQREIIASGAKLFFGIHPLAGLGRSFRLRWGGIDTAEIVAESFRRFSRGLKAAIECCIMLADAGLIPIDQDVVAVAGSGGGADSLTGGGADSALVVRPAHFNSFFDIKVREIIAMPRYRQKEEMLDILSRYKAGKEVNAIAAELELPEKIIAEYVSNYELVKKMLAKGATPKEIRLKMKIGLDTTRYYVELAKLLN